MPRPFLPAKSRRTGWLERQAIPELVESEMRSLKPMAASVVFLFSVFYDVAATAELDGLPAVGALVRVEAPRLGAWWHVGMFNRLRVELPCYRVAIFARDGSNRIAHTLGVKEIQRMQSHLVFEGRKKVAPPRALMGGEVSDDWAEVSIEALHATAAQCPS